MKIRNSSILKDLCNKSNLAFYYQEGSNDTLHYIENSDYETLDDATCHGFTIHAFNLSDNKLKEIDKNPLDYIDKYPMYGREKIFHDLSAEEISDCLFFVYGVKDAAFDTMSLVRPSSNEVWSLCRDNDVEIFAIYDPQKELEKELTMELEPDYSDMLETPTQPKETTADKYHKRLQALKQLDISDNQNNDDYSLDY